MKILTLSPHGGPSRYWVNSPWVCSPLGAVNSRGVYHREMWTSVRTYSERLLLELPE